MDRVLGVPHSRYHYALKGQLWTRSELKSAPVPVAKPVKKTSALHTFAYIYFQDLLFQNFETNMPNGLLNNWAFVYWDSCWHFISYIDLLMACSSIRHRWSRLWLPPSLTPNSRPPLLTPPIQAPPDTHRLEITAPVGWALNTNN